jgi:SagB-type dehydrogenase family enzyme
MEAGESRALPEPFQTPPTPLEVHLRARRSRRDFDGRALTDAEVGQLLWAAQGITDRSEGLRNAPSAGRAYPIELYVATPDGLFHYDAATHAVRMLDERDLRDDLMHAGLGQGAIWSASAVFVISADYARSEALFAERGRRYALLEAGHVGQNILLQATAMGLAGVPMGDVDDPSVRRVAHLRSRDEPVYLIAVGHPV